MKKTKLSAGILAAAIAVGGVGMGTVYAEPAGGSGSPTAAPSAAPSAAAAKLPEDKVELSKLVDNLKFIEQSVRTAKKEAVKNAENNTKALELYKAAVLLNEQGKVKAALQSLQSLTVGQLTKAIHDVDGANDMAAVEDVFTKAQLQNNKNELTESITANSKLSTELRDKLLAKVATAADQQALDAIRAEANAATGLDAAKEQAKTTVDGLRNLDKARKDALDKQIVDANDQSIVSAIVDAAKAYNGNRDAKLSEAQKDLVKKIDGSNLDALLKLQLINRTIAATKDEDFRAVKGEVLNQLDFDTVKKAALDRIDGFNLSKEDKETAKRDVNAVKFNNKVASSDVFAHTLDKWARKSGERNHKDGNLDTYYYGTTPVEWTGAMTVAGKDRYATAVKVSQKLFAKGARTVFVASGENYVDSLVAAPIAEKMGAQVLLTPSAKADRDMLDEIARLNPAQVIVVGGEQAVSAEVVQSIKETVKTGTVTRRISGDDRYGTAEMLAKTLTFPALENGNLTIAIGDNFPDALVAGALAGHNGGNLTIVPSTGLNETVARTIKFYKPKSVTVVGNVLSKNTLKAINKLTDVTVTRIGGVDRYATAARVAREFSGTTKPTYAVVTTGVNFPDAIVGSVPAIAQGGPVLLTRGKFSSDMYDSRDVPANQMLVGGVTAAIDAE